jgi:hypothetical protein
VAYRANRATCAKLRPQLADLSRCAFGQITPDDGANLATNPKVKLLRDGTGRPVALCGNYDSAEDRAVAGEVERSSRLVGVMIVRLNVAVKA